MTGVARRAVAWRIGAVTLLALASAAAFAAYFRPEMLVAAWGAILLCF